MGSGTELLADLNRIRDEALEEISGAADTRTLEEVRVRHMARKSPLNAILRGLKDVPPDERGRIGDAANKAKKTLETALQERKSALDGGEAGPAADPTLPGKRPPRGKPHLLTQVEDRILEIFRGMGFSVARGPDVEDDYHNFEALNMPEGHPAREMQDTFFTPGRAVLRTHTSPVQIRTMEKMEPPIRKVFPGRVYRRETPDATHSSEFHQIEVLYIDRLVTMKDLKGTLTEFAHEMFGGDLDVRFRPYYFPFVEPGAEMDIECFRCRGSGCRICKQSGWIEILGAGMVHPQVLRNVGYDPEQVSGYAAGMGVERIAMLRHGVPDIRLFYENDLRFLDQF